MKCFIPYFVLNVMCTGMHILFMCGFSNQNQFFFTLWLFIEFQSDRIKEWNEAWNEEKEKRQEGQGGPTDLHHPAPGPGGMRE